VLVMHHVCSTADGGITAHNLSGYGAHVCSLGSGPEEFDADGREGLDLCGNAISTHVELLSQGYLAHKKHPPRRGTSLIRNTLEGA
jgi:choline dehydrogenase-like flavoprotein